MLKSFTVGPNGIPNLYGPIGRGDDMDKFYKEWRHKTTPAGFTVVGRRDSAAGCFSLVMIADGRYDVAFYDDSTPKEVWDYIRAPREERVYLDCAYFQTDIRNKYVSMDLIAYLRRRGLWK